VLVPILIAISAAAGAVLLVLLILLFRHLSQLANALNRLNRDLVPLAEGLRGEADRLRERMQSLDERNEELRRHAERPAARRQEMRGTGR
jgi:uncharacterized membrane protein YccC